MFTQWSAETLLGVMSESPSLEHIRQELNRTGYDFLMTDLDTALTFTALAREAGNDTEKKLRNVMNAREAYFTVKRMREKLTFSSEQGIAFDKKLLELMQALEQLGESVQT